VLHTKLRLRAYYRIQLQQEIKDTDHPETVEYTNLMLNKSDEGFLRHILFTDEATLYSNSHINHHIHRIWGAEEPDKASECVCVCVCV
jgi:hypothetical protein